MPPILDKYEAIVMYDDLIKFVSVALLIHLLLFAVDDHDLFSEAALKLFLYLIISLLIYHLIIKKITNKLIKKPKI